jgi:hypothetical protein
MSDIFIKNQNEVLEKLSISDISGNYFISNMDNQIHNSNDRLHNIIDHCSWTEISIVDSEGGEIESCVLYKTLEDLLLITKGGKIHYEY